LLKINDNFFIYDTPGVMPKEIKTFKDGYVLSLINCINNDILPLHEIVNYLFLYCKDKYFKKMSDIFHINQQTDFETFIKNICRQYSFLRKNNEYDEPRAIKYIFDKFTNSYFFKINYEK
jgi:ribosome biogenesis GTPase A